MRLEILNEIDGVSFEECYRTAPVQGGQTEKSTL